MVVPEMAHVHGAGGSSSGPCYTRHMAVRDPRVRRFVDRLDANRRTLAQEVEDDVAPVRSLSLAERGVWVASVCRAAWSILQSRADAAEVVERQESPAPDLAARWQELMARRGPRPAGRP